MADRKRRWFLSALAMLITVSLVFWFYISTHPGSALYSWLPFSTQPQAGLVLDECRDIFERQLLTPYASNPENVRTLEDLASLDRERKMAYRQHFTDKAELGRRYHEVLWRPRPQHEIAIILKTLDEILAQSPIDLEELMSVRRPICFGVHDLSVLNKCIEIVERLQATYGNAIGTTRGSMSAECSSAMSACSSILDAVGHIAQPETLDYLSKFIPKEPPSVATSGAPEDLGATWKRMLLYGALFGIAELPPHMSIPALEEIYRNWSTPVQRTEELQDWENMDPDLRPLCDRIDAAYRQAYGDVPRFPPDSPPGDRIPSDWPGSRYRYAPGGTKVSL